MRRSHFETLGPLCPICRSPLRIATSIRADGDDILAGILTCSESSCQREYPIIDGIPVIVAAIRAWLAANPLQVLMRDDLSPELESLLGDVLGAGSPFDMLRQHISIYAGDHFGGGSAQRLLGRAPATAGPVIDTGCATGGTTFHLAKQTGALTLGVDLNFAMLRVASRALREGRVRYARRRGGLAYDRRDDAIEIASPELVDFWCCDVAALPFADATFAIAASINVIDCTSSPRDTIGELARVVKPGGTAILSTPYDWNPAATPVEHWLGGHSQRGPREGASEPMLRELLADAFEIVEDVEHEPWRLQLHDRSAVDYDVHVVVARRRG